MPTRPAISNPAALSATSSLAAPPVDTPATGEAVPVADLVAVFAEVVCRVAGTDMLLVGLTTGTLKLPPVPAGEEAVA